MPTIALVFAKADFAEVPCQLRLKRGVLYARGLPSEYLLPSPPPWFLLRHTETMSGTNQPALDASCA